MPTKKIFPKSYLTDELDLPYGAVQDLLVETNRWSEIHVIVFQDPEDGKYWQARYSQGLTENQDEQPWECDKTVEATEVEERDVTVKQWVAV